MKASSHHFVFTLLSYPELSPRMSNLREKDKLLNWTNFPGFIEGIILMPIPRIDPSHSI